MPTPFAAPLAVAFAVWSAAPSPSVALALAGDVDEDRGDGAACATWTGALVVSGCAATDADDPTSVLWPELTAAVGLTRGDLAVAIEVVERAALDDDDVTARAVVTFTF